MNYTVENKEEIVVTDAMIEAGQQAVMDFGLERVEQGAPYERELIMSILKTALSGRFP